MGIEERIEFCVEGCHIWAEYAYSIEGTKGSYFQKYFAELLYWLDMEKSVNNYIDIFEAVNQSIEVAFESIEVK